MEKGLTKNQIISMLNQSTHGKLEDYSSIGQQAASEDPEFLARLIAWNQIKGQVRDSKTALPIVSLTVPDYPPELVDNSLAHLALLSPRDLVKAYRFALQVRIPGKMRTFKRFTERYLRSKESKFDRVALQHRHSLKELYALNHTKPNEKANDILFKGVKPKGSLFELVSQLHDMPASEAAGAILNRHIPFLIAMGALREKAKEPDLVMALISGMTATELVTNSKMLEKLGVKTNPALRAAYADALSKASISKKATLKTSRAVEAVEDEGLKKKLQALQEKQLDALGGVDGNWLVLVDKSGSMTSAINMGKQIASLLARMVKGTVSLVFFNNSPRFFDVTGKTLADIEELARYERAGGATSIGCGLAMAMNKGVEIDGIAIVTDCGENCAPLFHQAYAEFVKRTGKLVPVYIYGFPDLWPEYRYSVAFHKTLGDIPVETFNVNDSTDYYSLPNLVQTMRTNRYSLVDEVYATQLLKLNDILEEK